MTKLSSGVWKNRSLSLRSRKHVEEILMWKDALLVVFPESCFISYQGGTTMEVLYPRCSGLDVHKRFVVACLSLVEANGRRHKELRQFGTITSEILALKDWLKASGCRQIAMESTGVFWIPLFHLLEDSFETYLLKT